jgi:hypothetical protein
MFLHTTEAPRTPSYTEELRFQEQMQILSADRYRRRPQDHQIIRSPDA